MGRRDYKTLSVQEAIELHKSGKLDDLDYTLFCMENGLMAWPEYNADQIRALRKKYDLTQKHLAVLLGGSQQTVMRWESQQDSPPPTVRHAFMSMEESLPHFISHLELTSKHPKYAVNKRRSYRASLKDAEAKAQADKAVTPLDLTEDRTPEGDLALRTMVINLRRRMSMTRGEFARFLNISPSSIDKWENGTGRPLGIVATFLKIMARDDDLSRQIIHLMQKSAQALAKSKKAASDKDEPHDQKLVD